jgi:hypothetical protein
MPLPVILIAVLAALAAAAQPSLDSARLELAARVTRLTRASQWTLVRTVPVQFRTYHPQGMVRIGEHLFVSSVEVTVPTRRYPSAVNGLDRDAGAGVGHLFKLDLSGRLVADLKLGEGAIYHPGGIDYDGHSIWVPVAEYRPNSRSIVYRVDPTAMTAAEVLRWPDHLGAIVHDTDDGSLHAVSWGSRMFYRWTLDANGRVRGEGPPQAVRSTNPAHYIDYQDCKYAGQHRMLCTGLAEMRPTAAAPPVRLGGLELVDLGDHRPLHQVAVPLWTAGGLDMTHNPVWLEPSANGLRGYFMPEDDTSRLYVFETSTPE